MPSPTLPATIVIHADDFGLSQRVNAGILEAYRDGVVTSTSLLANAPGAVEAVVEWRRLSAASDPATQPLDLGIHLNLTQGRPLTGTRYPSELLDGEGRFPGIGCVVLKLHRRRPKFEAAISAELDAQIGWLRDHGVVPSHLNGHQYVETLPGVAACLEPLLRRHGIAAMRVAVETGLARSVLWDDQSVSAYLLGLVKQGFATWFRKRTRLWPVRTTDGYFGTCHAGLMMPSTLSRFVSCMQPGGTYEIGVHPGRAAPSTSSGELADGWFDPLEEMRPIELAVLCSEEVKSLFRQRRLRMSNWTHVTGSRVPNAA
jgi:predicted glycoside hydrolase/deacetylase ChbG (UPF0249 family)